MPALKIRHIITLHEFDQTTRDLYAPRPNGRGGMTRPPTPPKVLLLCCSWGACVSRRPQRLCQLEFLAPGRFHHAGQALWERPDEMQHTAEYSNDPRGYVIWNISSFRSYHDEQALTEGPHKPAHHWCWQHQWNTDLMPTLLLYSLVVVLTNDVAIQLSGMHWLWPVPLVLLMPTALWYGIPSLSCW